MRVSDLAKRAGVGAHTIRYYVRARLLVPRRDPSNNYKQFGEQDIARLHFIKATQALGFSLGEVQQLLHGMDHGECPCSAIQEQLADKILQVRQEIASLEQRLGLMQSVYAGWDSSATGTLDVGGLCRYLESQTPAAHLMTGANMAAEGDSGAREITRSSAATPRKFNPPGSGEAPTRGDQGHPRRQQVLPAVELLQSGWRSALPASRTD